VETAKQPSDRVFRLSKSKIMVGLQCHKRLWLQTHRPELSKLSPKTEHIFQMGHLFGNLARRLMGDGELIGHERDLSRALAETPAALERARASGAVVFEPAFSHDDVCARTDGFKAEEDGWHLLEVKAAIAVKDYFIFDCAIQAWVAEGAGYPVRRVTLAIVNSDFVYAGDSNYTGLLREQDVTAEVATLKQSIVDVVLDLRHMLAKGEPKIHTGTHCTTPYECPFFEHCQSQDGAPPKCPVEVSKGTTARGMQAKGFADALELPIEYVDSPSNRRVLSVSCIGPTFYNSVVFQPLRELARPFYFLNLAAVRSPVPLWAGTRAFQHIPFQWSCRVEATPDDATYHEFLDTSGGFPAAAFARSLVDFLGESGPIIVYSHLEQVYLSQLRYLIPELRKDLSQIITRVVSLSPLVRRGYYHTSMRGNFSLTQVLLSLHPSFACPNQGDVPDDDAAQRGWWKASRECTPMLQRDELRAASLRYGRWRTQAMIAIHHALASGDVLGPNALIPRLNCT
jgi:hypothetical protein